MKATHDLSRLLAAQRAISPPPQAAEQGLERLLGALAAQAPALPVAAGSLQLGGSVVAKWIGVGFAVGLAGAGAVAQVSVQPSRAEQTAVAVDARAPHGSPSVMNVEVLALPVPSAAFESAPKSVPEPTASRPALRAAATASDSPSFDEELRLIARAKQELSAGRPHLAEVWLGEHLQRFPSGVFGLEREVLSIVARCSQRKSPEFVRDFAVRHPDSPMLDQLRRKCGAVEGAGGNAASSGDFSSPTNAPALPGEPTDN